MLVGFHCETTQTILLKLFTCDDLKSYAKQKQRQLNVDSAITRMEEHLKEIIKYIQNTNWGGKTIEIMKYMVNQREKLYFKITEAPFKK